MSAWQTFLVTLDDSGVPHFTRQRFAGYAEWLAQGGQASASSQPPGLQALPAGVRPLAWAGLDPGRAQVLWNDGVIESGVPVPAGLGRVDRAWLGALSALHPEADGGPRLARQAREHWLSEVLARGLEDHPPRWQLSALVPGGALLHAEQYPLVKLSSDHHALVYPGAQPPKHAWAGLHHVTFGLSRKLGGPVEARLRLPRAALGDRTGRRPPDAGARLRGHLAVRLEEAALTAQDVAVHLAQHLAGEVRPASGHWDELIALEECAGLRPLNASGALNRHPHVKGEETHAP